MKLSLVLPSLLIAVAFVAPPLCAQDSSAAPATPAPASAEKTPKTELEKQMDHISKSMRALKKQIKDPARNASSLVLLGAIHDAAIASTKLFPAKAEDFTGAEKDKFIAAYQAGMKDFADAVGKVADALRANDNVAAAADYKHLFSIEKQDHKQFRRPEKD